MVSVMIVTIQKHQRSLFFCILTLFIFTDVKTNLCLDQVDAQHGKTLFGEDNSPEQEGVMDFAEGEIAEQLTHIDSVRNKMLKSCMLSLSNIDSLANGCF